LLSFENTIIALENNIAVLKSNLISYENSIIELEIYLETFKNNIEDFESSIIAFKVKELIKKYGHIEEKNLENANE
jgi:hypothetical protein